MAVNWENQSCCCAMCTSKGLVALGSGPGLSLGASAGVWLGRGELEQPGTGRTRG